MTVKKKVPVFVDGPLSISLALAVIAALAAGPATADGRDVRVVNAVVAAIDGAPITLADLDRFAGGRGQLLPGSDRANRESLLEAMIELELFDSEFRKQGIVADDADTEAYIESILAQSGSTRDDIKRALGEIGLKWTHYFERMRVEVQKLALMSREIRTRANVTPEEVERYWRQNDEFKRPERVEIGHIYIPLPADGNAAETEMARRRIADAARLSQRDFAEAAREYSAGPTADAGGVIGVFERGSMAILFERAVARLDDGEVSEPFEVQGAVHIIKRLRSFAPDRVELSEVEEDIRQRLYDELIQDRYRRWVDEELWPRHHVVNNLESIDTLLDRSDLDPS